MSDENMSVVVIGASAGGLTGLLRIVQGFPEALPAAVLIAVHIGQGPSGLPGILGRASVLPCSHATDGEPIRPGHVYVAPPDYHLLVHDGHLELSRGPREHHTRPAIDPLFTSAARAFGPRVIGIVLSGAMSDGTAGLMAIKTRGGRVIVQDPEEALSAGMPRSALGAVKADAVLPAAEIADAVLAMLNERVDTPVRGADMGLEPEDLVAKRIREDIKEQARNRRVGELTPFTCPDCGGTLWQSSLTPLLNFRCHVGHAWSWEALVNNKSDELETALWASVRLLVERATLNRQIAARARSNGSAAQGARFAEQADRDQDYATLIRGLLESFSSYSDMSGGSSIAE